MKTRTQYFIYKITTDKIIKKDYNITNYNKDLALHCGELVGIADNLLFHKIRDYYKTFYPDVDKSGRFSMLDDVVIVKVPKKNENEKNNKENLENYERVLVDEDETPKGVTINGVHFIRLCCSSGQLRNNSATLIRAELHDYLVDSFMCGLDNDTFGKTLLSKFNSYFALTTSGLSMLGGIPRMAVIRDYDDVIKPHELVEFIYPDVRTMPKQEGTELVYIEGVSDPSRKPSPDSKRKKKIIEMKSERVWYDEKDVLPPLNPFDGMGLCTPTWSKAMAKELGYDYCPASVVYRGPWIKGMLATVPFPDFFEEYGVEEIIDVFGMHHRVKDLDIILTASQFKTWKAYDKKYGIDAWAKYIEQVKLHNMRFGIVKPNKKYDSNERELNYQYINALDIPQDKVPELCAPSVNMLTELCSDNFEKQYYSIMRYIDNDKIKLEIEGKSEDDKNKFSILQKALFVNKELLGDNYIQKLLLKQCDKKFNDAKLGRILCDGNYSTVIADPVAFMEHAIKNCSPYKGEIEVQGVLGPYHIYSHYWNKNAAGDKVLMMRSPLIDVSEPTVVTLAISDKMQRWFKYLKSGIVTSCFDLADLRCGGMDKDGDIIFSTDSELLIDSVHKNELPIAYDLDFPKKENPIALKNLVKADMAGMFTKIGQLSNYSASFYAKQKMFLVGSMEYNEIRNSIKALNRVVSQEIDRAKTSIKKLDEPTSWKRIKKPVDSDFYTPKEGEMIDKHNMLTPLESPYYLRYRYKSTDDEVRNHESVYNRTAKTWWDMSILELDEYVKSFPADGLTATQQEQKDLVMRYWKYYPVCDSDCTMNLICHTFEKLHKQLKSKVKGRNMLFDCCDTVGYDSSKVTAMLEVESKYSASKKHIQRMFHKLEDKEDINNYHDKLSILEDYLQTEMKAICENPKERFNNLCGLCKVHKIDESIVWEGMGNEIFELIKGES